MEEGGKAKESRHCNSIARKVKVEDVKHNSDTSRLTNPNDKAFMKMDLYREAIKILEEVGLTEPDLTK